jgi:hypothetical protein
MLAQLEGGFRGYMRVLDMMNTGEDVNSMWDEISTHIRNVTIEVFGVIRENKREPKNTWWCNDNVQNTISEKK